jgi:hypothetical protein
VAFPWDIILIITTITTTRWRTIICCCMHVTVSVQQVVSCNAWRRSWIHWFVFLRFVPFKDGPVVNISWW